MTRSVEVSVGSACIGSGSCRRTDPEAFGEDEQHRAVVLAPVLPENDALWAALDGCPVEALSARDAVTGEQLFP